jgi:hypothetical protein
MAGAGPARLVRHVRRLLMLSMIRRLFGFSQPALPRSGQSADVAAPGADSPAPIAAAPAANQAADWLALRRAAGWQALESKPAGRREAADE